MFAKGTSLIYSRLISGPWAMKSDCKYSSLYCMAFSSSTAVYVSNSIGKDQLKLYVYDNRNSRSYLYGIMLHLSR